MGAQILNQIIEAVGRTPDNMRQGQVAFNALNTLRPDWAEEIRGSGLDTFHNDAALPAFYKWVGRKGGSR